jgi:hypothetical protein
MILASDAESCTSLGTTAVLADWQFMHEQSASSAALNQM